MQNPSRPLLVSHELLTGITIQNGKKQQVRKIKKPVNTRFYRLLKNIDHLICGPYDTILEPLSF